MAKKLTFKRKIERLTKEMHDKYATYLTAHQKFAAYEGKTFKEIGLENLQSMLHDIQVSFAELYPVLEFINQYQNFSAKTLKNYQKFEETLEKQGAKRKEPPAIS